MWRVDHVAGFKGPSRDRRGPIEAPLGLAVNRRWFTAAFSHIFLPAPQLMDEHTGSLVSVVIPCYKHANFLAEAIESVLAQTHRQREIVVVDDGSPDHTQEVATRYPGVRYVRQDHRGVSAARNTGIRESQHPYVVFLDADDRLLPNALEAGLTCFKAHPECAFVSGGFRRIGADGLVSGEPVIPFINTDHYVEMLRRSYISMHATVMFRREILELVGGYDSSLRACEDYDIYLRVLRRRPVCCHSAIVAEYRGHNAPNLSSDNQLMLTTALRVLRSQWRYVKADSRCREAYGVGMRFWRECYGLKLIAESKRAIAKGRPRRAIRASMALLRLAPAFASRRLVSSIDSEGKRLAARVVRTILPAPMVLSLRNCFAGRREPLPLGGVRLGDLDRVTPVSRAGGLDRGLPIDRYYIEGFLFRCASDISGRVLETADNDYTRRFGGARVVSSDILDVDGRSPSATFVADLATAPQIPSDGFDCVILTQTLHLIHDVKAALQTLHRILRPGGVLLVTVPGISQVGQGVRGNGWHRPFTHDSLRRLFEEVFLPTNVQVEDHGNVFAAISLLHGLALAEVPTQSLDYHDSAYQVIIAARAVKAHAGHETVCEPARS